MSVMALNYSRYMYFNFNYNFKMNYLKSIFDNTYDILTNEKFLDDDIFKTLSEYPKYPNISMIFNKVLLFNFMKIYGITPESPKYLLDQITNDDAKTTKIKMDKIPNKSQQILNDMYFQYSCISTNDEIFNYTNSLYSFRYEESLRNFYHELLINSGFNIDKLKTSSGSFLYFFHNFLTMTFPSFFNISIPLVSSIRQNSAMTSDVLKTDFNTFIDNNVDQMSKDIFRIYIKCLYKFNRSASNFQDDVSVSLKPSILKLKTLMESFLKIKANKAVFEISKIVDELTCQILASKSISETFPNQEYILSFDPNLFTFFNGDSNPVADLISDEDTEYYIFKQKAATDMMLRDFMNVAYLYKEHAEKFINIVFPVIHSYIDNYIKPESTEFIPYYNLMNLYQSIFVRQMDYDYLSNWMIANIDVDYIKTQISDYNILKYAFSYYFTGLIDDFFELSDFKSIIEEILETCFKTLRNNGHVDYNFSWYDYVPFMYHYFRVFFRKNIIDNNIFTQTFDNTQICLTDVLNNMESPNFKTEIFSITAQNMISTNGLNMYRFVENLMNSTLTREIGQGVLKVFMN